MYSQLKSKWAQAGVLITLVLVVVLALGSASCNNPAATGGSEARSDLERILQNRVIRCAYVSNPPSCIIDPNSKKVSGIVAESIQTIAESASVKVEWTEEVGFGSMVEGLRARRYDLVPCAIWPTAARAREADFTNPLFYSGVGAYARAKENRFKSNLNAINSPNVRIATIDGELGETIAQTQFSNAQRVGLPQATEITTVLLNVKENKADIAFVEKFFAYEFLQKNPGSLVNIAPDQPVRVFPNTILLRRGQPEFKAFLNTAIEEQLNPGAIERLISKYEPAPGTFYRLSRPYSTGGPTR